MKGVWVKVCSSSGKPGWLFLPFGLTASGLEQTPVLMGPRAWLLTLLSPLGVVCYTWGCLGLWGWCPGARPLLSPLWHASRGAQWAPLVIITCLNYGGPLPVPAAAACMMYWC